MFSYGQQPNRYAGSEGTSLERGKRDDQVAAGHLAGRGQAAGAKRHSMNVTHGLAKDSL